MTQQDIVMRVKKHHPALYDECHSAWRSRGRSVPTDLFDHIIEEVGFRTRLAGEGHSRYHEALWLWI